MARKVLCKAPRNRFVHSSENMEYRTLTSTARISKSFIHSRLCFPIFHIFLTFLFRTNFQFFLLIFSREVVRQNSRHARPIVQVANDSDGRFLTGYEAYIRDQRIERCTNAVILEPFSSERVDFGEIWTSAVKLT